MFYLYLKIHNQTGLKYLGFTSKNPFKYKGSGKYWKSHIKIHGYDVDTQILLCTECKFELKETGIFFSRLWNIVKSNEYANLTEESAYGGPTFTGKRHTKETRIKMSKAKIGKPSNRKGLKVGPHNEKHKAKISNALKNRVFDKQHRQKISKALSGKIRSTKHAENIAKANSIKLSFRGEVYYGFKSIEEKFNLTKYFILKDPTFKRL